MRPSRDELGLLLARTWALRGTCGRRRVGCVLTDRDGHQVGSGYNGPASGVPNCGDDALAGDVACPGLGLPSGQGLELCEAVHAEANALLRCRDVREVHAAYVTHSPCVHCVKLLMNTGCQRVVFETPYAHNFTARELWERSRRGRTWERVSVPFTLALYEPTYR
jgi:dCMP deaminase